MSTPRYLLAEVAAAGGLAWLALSAGFASVEDPWLAAWLGAGFLLLEVFHVQLPRGGASSMSAALLALAVIYLNSTEAMLAVLVPSVLVSLGRSAGRTVLDRFQALAQNGVVLFAAMIVWQYLDADPRWPKLMTVSVVSLAAVGLDFWLTQLRSSLKQATPIRGLIMGGLRLQGTMSAALVSTAVFGYVILDDMGFWGVVVITLLLLIMRQAFALLVSVRRAYQSTMQALVRTVEAQDPAKSGHAERVATLASEVGRQMGLVSHELERLSYAALVHDLGEVGSDGVGAGGGVGDTLSAAEMIRDVGFLSDVNGVLQVSENPLRESQAASDEDCLLAYIVLVSSRTDDLAQGKPTAEDASRIAALDTQIDEVDKRRLEMAFRASTQRLPGRLFAVPDDRVGA